MKLAYKLRILLLKLSKNSIDIKRSLMTAIYHKKEFISEIIYAIIYNTSYSPQAKLVEYDAILSSDSKTSRRIDLISISIF